VFGWWLVPGVELGDELSVGCAGGVEFVVAVGELPSQFDGPLFESGDLGLQGFGVWRVAEPCAGPDGLAELFDEALFERADVGVLAAELGRRWRR
jgi:hypothetical protein